MDLSLGRRIRSHIQGAPSIRLRFRIGRRRRKIYSTHGIWSDEVRQGLRTIFTHMYTQKWLHPRELSGIVISGMGDSEPFPALLHYHVGTIVGGRLRFIKQDEVRVGQYEEDSDAFVMPFAQRKMIELFYEGISEEVKEKLGEIISECIVASITKKGKEPSPSLTQKIEREVLEALKREIQENYTSPLLEAVAALPRHELAGLAETLVSLTALQGKDVRGGRRHRCRSDRCSCDFKGGWIRVDKAKGPSSGNCASILMSGKTASRKSTTRTEPLQKIDSRAESLQVSRRVS